MVLKYCKKRFLAYANRDGLYSMQGNVDPMKFHSVFMCWITLFSVMDNVPIAWWMLLSPINTGTSSVIAATSMLISLSHYIRKKELHLITESGTYLLLMTYQIIITTSIIKGRKHFHNLIREIKSDFHYICNKGHKYRAKFFKNQVTTFKWSIFMIALTALVAIGMTVSASAGIIVTTLNRDESTDRPLPFPFWLFDYDLTASPVYYIIMVASLWFTCNHAYIYAFMMQCHVIWLREITCKADIIAWNLEELLVDVFPAKNFMEKEHYAAIIKHRMKDIIRMHHSMLDLMCDYASVYNKCLLFEQTIASPLICMTAYCFVEKLEAGDFQLLLIMLSMGITIGTSIPNYLGTHVLDKVQSVSDACWGTPFWNAGPVISPYLVLIMQRSIRPLPLGAAGFGDISLQTYSTIVTRAYSCFNMLRQLDLDIQ